MLESLDAAVIRRWSAAGLAALRGHQRQIDQLNVFPVPDADTGTNLVLTVTAADAALADRPDLDGLGAALGCLARGAVIGARGNSGAIISQLLRGAADALAGVDRAGGAGLAHALRAAHDAAVAAVAHPMPGTMLSITEAAAKAAEAAAGGARDAATPGAGGLAAVAVAAAEAAVEALRHTPEQLPTLARAGVVDAGGLGLVIIFEALAEIIADRPPTADLVGPAARPGTVARETGSEAYAYEVQYLLEAPAARMPGLRVELSTLGDSLVIVGADAVGTVDGDGVWNVHVHVNDVGAAIEAGIRAGRPHRISVTRFADGVAANHAHAGVPEGVAVVVVARGCPGLADLFAGEGVAAWTDHVAPTTADLLTAIRATGRRQVVVLPDDPDARAAAAAAADTVRVEGVQVGVVPTRSPVQALAALAVRDASRRFGDDIIAMAEAAGACRYAEISVAESDALTVAGRATAGDHIALVDGEVNVIGRELTEVCVTALDRMLSGGGELVTLVTGADAPEGLAATLTAHLATAWPFVEARAYHGGQSDRPLLLGVE
ncbi:DAK2 domain-containing protein [Luedemannella helvata]|uniref:DAK2 domain-containing protein n=1 Tax=Luedemannella helvata TaxID=349315 RepID=UPI0031D7CB62